MGSQGGDWLGWRVLAPVFAAALFGGLLAALAPLRSDDPRREWTDLRRFCHGFVYALLAVCLVPILLGAVASDLLKSLFSTSATDLWVALSQFTAYCALAALLPEQIVQRTGESVLARLNTVEKKAEEASRAAKVAETAVTEPKTTPPSPKPQSIVGDLPQGLLNDPSTIPASDLNLDEEMLRDAFRNGTSVFPLRTVESLAKDSKLPVETVQLLLTSLEKRRLVRTVETSEGPRYQWVGS
jgi:hypothetical protein